MSHIVLFLELAVITLLGIFVACKVFAYDISLLRKLGAACCFAALNAVNIPIFPLDILVPALGLYFCLMDDSYARSTVNKVFALTFVFDVIATLALYSLKQGSQV